MLRVLVIVDHAVGISGPHRNVVGSLNALAARDDVALRLLCGRVDPQEPYARCGKVDIHEGFRPHEPAAFFSNLLKLRRCAKDIDVVYVPSGLKALLYAQTVRFGKRVIASPNVSPLPVRKADSPGWIELRLLTHLWLEASRARFDHVVRYTRSARIRHVPHSIDGNKFTPAKRNPAIWSKYGIRQNSVKVLFVGRDNDSCKGVPQLLDAAELLSQSSSAELLDFVLVGRMSEAAAVRADRLQQVHLLGFRTGDELATIYASSDIAVVPSSWEGFGFTVLESLASGLAVIGSSAGGIPEQIGEADCGRLLDIVGPDGTHKPDAGKVLASAIDELVRNPESRRTLGANGRKRAESAFSEALLGQRLMTVFSEDRR